MFTLRKLCVSALLVVSGASVASAVTVGQLDDFEDGTSQNWVNNLLGMGGPVPPPVNVPTGGPNGVDDAFLRIVSNGGSGAGGRLVAISLAQWAGDYIAAGVTHFHMNVNNEGPTDLRLRLMFSDPAGAPPANVAISTNSVLVPAGSGWTSLEFSVTPGFLTAVTGNVLPALTGATELRLFHSATLGLPPDPVAGQLGVDNIQALAIPLPAVLPMGLVTLGLAAYLRRSNVAR